jgi:hypothetical protein
MVMMLQSMSKQSARPISNPTFPSSNISGRSLLELFTYALRERENM